MNAAEDKNCVDLCARIRVAFGDRPRPNLNEITTCSCEECKEIRDYFDDADQFCHDASTLRFFDPALFLFAPKAFCYWLPAFMIAALENPRQADVIVDTLPSALDKRSELEGMFSASQRDAIIAFLDEGARRFDPEKADSPYRNALDVMRRRNPS